jgi:lipopolysaccharide transport system ATP-binding protein
MSSELALRVEQLGKCYPIYNHPRDRLLQAFWGQRRQLHRPFWALQDVSFELPRGRTLGVVGRNGSGKSTLLQLICGTLTPSSGSVQARGRIGALLELGSGFNPEFSGLENVFLNGALLGLSRREIEDRLDTILAFADIGSFIDQPVKTYSSGMAVRLAFAVQAHVQPDLLVVDEALAVGDEMFQKKCYAHLERLKQEGTAILLVTHSCPQILQHCDDALLLHGGRLRLLGAPKLVTGTYQRLCNAPADQWDALLNKLASADANDNTEGDQPETTQDDQQDPHLIPSSSLSYEARGIRIERVEVLNSEGQPANLFDMAQPFSLRFHVVAEQALQDLELACNIANHTGVRITGQHHPGPDCQAGDSFSFTFHFQAGLLPGLYFVGGGIWQRDQPKQFLHRVVDSCALRISSDTAVSSFGLCDLQAAPPSLEQAPTSC